VHGCFWHRHPYCKYAYNPKSREDFWQGKFRQNVERHQQVTRQLDDLGWRTIVIWECETSNIEQLRSSLFQLLEVF
jgi:DNA mismatch endonuclease (patch repair protein)